MSLLRLLALGAALCALSSCGLKYDLYMPDESKAATESPAVAETAAAPHVS
ncbi:MAG TPA: hypothetical protein IAB18_00240 [Candidatus Avisuccinivibrio pullicola]|nr:hypothetical protein [Candidatus Avisuccinivibrio pullicola]